MKIISCYIKGFGLFSNKELTFNDGLNCLYEINGQGKTTLASFIKAMLYGMESYWENCKDFRDRKHYKPFNSTSYGGNLIFAHDNKTYRVERTFDTKRQEKDVVNIYVNDVKKVFDKEIGEAILQLDKDTFERLMYITSADIKIESSSNIKKHLNNIIDGTDESFNYEDIYKNVLYHKNKYIRTKNSLIPEEQEKSKKLLQEIKNTEVVEKDLELKYQAYNEFIKLREELNFKVQKQAYYEAYYTNIEKLQESKNRLASIINNYPNSYPKEDEINSLKNATQKIEQLQNDEFFENVISEEQLTKALATKDKYSNGFPTEDETNNLLKLFDEKEQIEKNLLLNSYDETKLNYYQTLPLDEISIHKLITQYEQYKLIAGNLSSYQEEIKIKNDDTSNTKLTNKLLVIALILLLFVVVGGMGLIFRFQIPGIIVTILGLLGLVVVGFIYLSKKIDSKNNHYALNEKTDNLNLDLYKKINETIKQYGNFNNLKDGYDTIIAFWNDYRSILEKKNAKERYLKQENDNNKQIENILLKYHIDEKVNSYKELEQFINIQKDILERLKQYQNIKDKKESKLQECQNTISKIYMKYALGNKTVAEIIDDCNNIKMLQTSIVNDEKELDLYRKKYHIEDNLEKIDFKADLAEINKKIEDIKVQINDDEDKIASLDKQEKEYILSLQKIEKYSQNVEVLEHIANYLNQAQVNLDQKYVRPIKERFEEYMKVLQEVTNFSIDIDMDFEAQLKIKGETKLIDYLSSAQQYMCSLCLRLALADSIYDGEIPFIIMDDPFVYLDANNLQRVSTLLKKVLNNKQIIYLTCHESRKIAI